MLKRLFAVMISFAAAANAVAQWSQFGGNPRHTSSATLAGQPLANILTDVVYDPFAPLEIQEGGGNLYVHYAVPLLDGDDVFMGFKSGTYAGMAVWQTQTRSVHRLHWEGGKLVDLWTAASDWLPVPTGGAVNFEPVFHAALAKNFVYEPGVGGTVLQFNRTDGLLIKRINPFGMSVDPSIYVAGPLTVDAAGNILYTALRFDPAADPWSSDVKGAWLVRIATDGSAKTVPFSTIVPDAPKASDECLAEFAPNQRPWPPSPEAVPQAIPCGSQRPGINIAPAIAPDGTIYIVSRAHFNSYYSYLIAVSPDLRPKWAASLRNRFHDGCNVLLPADVTKGGCRAGAITGVDPAQNVPGAGRVNDNSSSSPAVAPDGSIFYGSYTNYNDPSQGHLIHFSSDGMYLNAYPFGWDTTPAIYPHDGTYSVITKENHYGGPVHPDPGFFITQLDPNLNVEWQFQNTSTQTCGPDSQGQIACSDEEPFGFEWCVNAPAVDSQGTVYVGSENRILYAIRQGGVLMDRIFLPVAEGAAYTPVAIGPDGKVYAQNAGHLFAIGGTRPRVRATKH